MKLSEIGSRGCPMAQALTETGDAWSMLILREALYGRTRFSDFATHTGAQKTVVSARLKQLVEAGILEREAYSEYPTRYRYQLTEKGRDLTKVLILLGEWGTRWVDEPNQNELSLTHEQCGQRLKVEVHCGSCGAEVDNVDITARPAHERFSA